MSPPAVDLSPITEDTIPEIRHLNEIDGQHVLVRGGRPPGEEAIQKLAANGTKFILDLQGGDYAGNAIVGGLVPFWEKGEKPEEIEQERIWAQQNGIDFISLPLNSLKRVNAENLANIVKALEIMHQYKEANGSLGKLYMHCAHGVDRTGLVVALYRVLYEGWDVDVAYAEWRLSGHSLANMTVTWHLDEFFFAAVQSLRKSGFPLTRSGLCEYNLIL
jgi:protein tyrosine/serine phosphatase